MATLLVSMSKRFELLARTSNKIVGEYCGRPKHKTMMGAESGSELGIISTSQAQRETLC